MDDDTGEMKVNEETTTVAAHLRLVDQFFGFCLSSGPSHVTCINFSSMTLNSTFRNTD